MLVGDDDSVISMTAQFAVQGLAVHRPLSIHVNRFNTINNSMQ